MADLKWVMQIVDKATAPARAINKSLQGVNSTLKKLDFDRLSARASRGLQRLGRAGKDAGRVFATELAPKAIAGLSAIGAAAGATALAFAKMAVDDVVAGEKLDWQLKQVIKDTDAFDKAIQDVNSLASILGDDPDVIQSQLTKLVAKGHSVASAFKIIQGQADLAALGADANALISAFTDLDDKGKLSAKSIANVLSGSGLDPEKFRKLLGEATGTSGNLDEIENAIKSGALDAATLQATALKAITDKTGKELGGAAKDFSDNTLPGILASLKTAPGRLLNAFDASGAMEPAKRALGQLVTALDPSSDTGKKLVEVLNKVSNAAADILSTVSVDDVIKAVSGFATFLDVVFDLTSALFGGLWDGLSFILQPVKDLIQQLDDGEGQTSFWIDALKTFGRVVGFVLGAIVLGIGAIAAVVLGAIEIVRRFVVGVWVGITKVPGAFWDAYYEIAGVFDSLFAYLGEVWESFKSFGKAIADGIYDGLKGAWANLISKFKALLNMLPDAVKKTLGIASPSKVMMELGGYTVEGFHRGVASGAEDTQAALSQAIAPPKMTLSGIVASSTSSSSGSRSMSVGDIIVNVGGSSASPESIGKAVRDEVLSVFRGALVEAGA